MGSNEGRAWLSLGGVGHVELSEGLFGLTPLVGFCQSKLQRIIFPMADSLSLLRSCKLNT